MRFPGKQRAEIQNQHFLEIFLGFTEKASPSRWFNIGTFLKALVTYGKEMLISVKSCADESSSSDTELFGDSTNCEYLTKLLQMWNKIYFVLVIFVGSHTKNSI